MSYCRWSTNDFQCDVYVYASAEGWVTHVASMRVVWTDPLPPVLTGPFDVDAWLERSRVVQELLDRAGRTPIGLPNDGVTYVDHTAAAAARRLDDLRHTGYLVPQDVIDVLAQEPS